MNKRIKYVLTFSILTTSIFSCNSGGADQLTSDSLYEKMSITDFDKQDGYFLCKIDNNVESYSLIDRVKTPFNRNWKLYDDIEGKSEIKSKIISCNIGHNYSYLLVEEKEKTIGFYKIDIYRLDLYKVSFETYGGTKIDSIIVQEESLVPRPTSPKKDGFSFIRWDYNFGDPVKSDLIINAIWNANEYLITFDANGGGVETKEIKVKYNDYVSLPQPKYRGHNFIGWFLGESKVESSCWRYTSNVTLIARWEISTYSITYVLNGGSLENHESIQEIKYGDIINLYKANRIGYEFLGWYYKNTLFNYSIWNFEENISLEARWRAKQYTISYNLNGGCFENETISDIAIYDQNINLPIASKEVYEFLGWFLNGDKIISGIWKIDSNVELIAKWEPNVYQANLNILSSKIKANVIFDYNDGSGLKEHFRVSGGGNEKIKYVVPKNTDKLIFAGWSLDKEGENIFDFNDNNNLIKQDITLYGKWIEKDYGWMTTLNYNEKKNIDKTVNKVTGIGGQISTFVNFLPLESSGIVLNIVSSNEISVNLKKYNEKNSTLAQKQFSNISVNKIDGNLFKTSCYLTGNDVELGHLFTTNISGKNGDSVVKYVELRHSLGKLSCNAGLDPTIEKKINVVFAQQFDLGVAYMEQYEFDGWYTEEDGNGVKVTDKNGVSLSPYNFPKDMNFYAHFTSK